MKRVRVGDVLRLKRRPAAVDPTAEYVSIGVRSFGKGIFHYPPTTGAELSKLRFFGIRPGELVLSNIKAWEGAIAVSSAADAGSIGSNRFLTYEPIDGAIDVRYACYFFLSEAGLPLIQKASPGSADRNRTLAIDRFENLAIPLPGIAEQQQLVAALERVAERCQAGQLLAQRAHALASALPAAFAHRPSEHGPAGPESRVPLGEVMSPAIDPTPVEAGRLYPNVGVYSFARGLFEKEPIDGALTSAKTLYRIRAGQVIYSRLFAFEGAYAAVDPRFDGYFVSNEFPVFDVDESRVDVRFLAAYFTSPAVWEELSAGSKGLGLRRQRVHPERVLAHSIWLPPLDEQQAIGRTLDRARRIAELRSLAQSRLSALKVSVLNRAFAGSR